MKEIEFESCKKPIGYQIRLADFIGYTDSISEHFQGGLVQFLGLGNEENSKNLLLSLKPPNLDFNNSCSKAGISLSTINGKKEITVKKYHELLRELKILENNPKNINFYFDSYNDNDTVNASKKRLQKSAERSVKFTK